MTKERIEDLMNKGYITRVANIDKLAEMTEAELMEKGYITQIGVFDGLDDTTEEVPVEATPSVAMNDDTTTPAVDDGEGDDVTPTDEPTADPDDAPVVDDGDETVEE